MRARNLKPAFFKNELLGTADPVIGHVFQGLWCMADREGRLEDRPLRIHAEINPYRHQTSTVLALDWLGVHEFIQRYEVNGYKYICVLKFTEHNQPHVKEAASKLPEPPKLLNYIEHCTSTVLAPDKHGSSTEVAALNPESLLLNPESLLLEADSKKPQLKRIPRKALIGEFSLTDDLIAYTRAKLPNVDGRELFQQFKDHHLAKATTAADWPASWRTWVRNALKFGYPKLATSQDKFVC